MAIPPTLETDRMILRPHVAQDFDDCLRLWSDPHTVRFIGGQVQDAQAVWFRMLRYAGMWAMIGYGFWVFEEKVSGRYMGEGGLMDARRGIAGLAGMPEIGWALLPDAGGRGLATEAVRAILNWADAVLHAQKTGCIIEPANIASIAVADKCGYRTAAQIDRGGTALILMERDNPL